MQTFVEDFPRERAMADQLAGMDPLESLLGRALAGSMGGYTLSRQGLSEIMDYSRSGHHSSSSYTTTPPSYRLSGGETTPSMASATVRQMSIPSLCSESTISAPSERAPNEYETFTTGPLPAHFDPLDFASFEDATPRTVNWGSSVVIPPVATGMLCFMECGFPLNSKDDFIAHFVADHCSVEYLTRTIKCHPDCCEDGVFTLETNTRATGIPSLEKRAAKTALLQKWLSHVYDKYEHSNDRPTLFEGFWESSANIIGSWNEHQTNQGLVFDLTPQAGP